MIPRRRTSPRASIPSARRREPTTDIGMNASQEWIEHWDGLKNRRLSVAFAAATWLVLWIVLGAAGLLVGFLLLLVTYGHLRAWRCPRCLLPIVGAGFRTFTDRCRSCDLELFSHAIHVQTPIEWTNPGALALSRRTRRFVAGYEIGAGAILMVISAFVRAPWWLILTLEGLAGLSLAAGIWLWRDDSRGYALTRTMQLIQLIRLQSPWLTYVAKAGLAIDVTHLETGVNLGTSFQAEFALVPMPGQTFGVAVNLWAAALLLVLLQAKPRADSPAVVPSSEARQEPEPVR
jgi:hypothetical protein